MSVAALPMPTDPNAIEEHQPMSIYSIIYYNLCKEKSQLIEKWTPGSGLHRHHIIPKHSGGTDNPNNFTYLTVREHILAHFMLWKMYKNINDLRSMKMLGANLSVEYRRKIGIFCRDNKIGFFAASEEQKDAWRKIGNNTQMLNKLGIFGGTIEDRQRRASCGGKASIKSPNNPWSYWASKDGQLERASLGGKTHSGNKQMYKPDDKTFVRVRPENIDQFLLDGYIFGTPIISKRLGIKTNIPSTHRRKVTDGITIYDSVEIAAKEQNITPSAIVYRCKSLKNTNWQYVS